MKDIPRVEGRSSRPLKAQPQNFTASLPPCSIDMKRFQKQPRLKEGEESLPLKAERMKSDCKIICGMGDMTQPSLQALGDVGMGGMCFVSEKNTDLGEAREEE